MSYLCALKGSPTLELPLTMPYPVRIARKRKVESANESTTDSERDYPPPATAPHFLVPEQHEQDAVSALKALGYVQSDIFSALEMPVSYVPSLLLHISQYLLTRLRRHKAALRRCCWMVLVSRTTSARLCVPSLHGHMLTCWSKGSSTM